MLSFLARQSCRFFLRGQRRPHRNKSAHRRQLEVELLERRDLLAGTWTPLTNLAPGVAGQFGRTVSTMLLQTDGTVMVQGGDSSSSWFKLTPDASGGYINGTWSTLASMSTGRLYYGSAVLPSGKVFVVGGEYSGSSATQDWINTAEIYDPIANSWSPATTFPQSQFGDDPVQLLANGQILAGYLSGPQTYLYNPANNTWTATGTKLRSDQSDEESWVKLPDGSILSYDVFSSISTGVGHAQRYIPSSGTWVDAGTVPVPLSSSSVPGNSNFYELGPGLLLPDGRVFLVGATPPNNGSTYTAGAYTALYTPSTNTWAAGPSIPAVGYGNDDGPGAILPNGHVIFTADVPYGNAPTLLFDFDPVANTITQMTLPSALSSVLNSRPAFIDRMVMLPSGDLLFGDGTNQLWDYNPNAAPTAGSQPTISSIVSNGGLTYTLTGTQLNGISEGAAYGDDAQMASNYPIVELTSSGGTVYFARTTNWISQVATGSTPVTTQFTLPAGIPGGMYNLTVTANGITSAPVSFPILAVTSTNPPVGGTAIFSGGAFALSVNFNEPIDPATAATSNLTLSQGTVSGVSVLPGNQTVIYSITGLTTNGSLTVSIPGGTVMDASDDPGFTPFSGTYTVQSGTAAYPTPLGASSPAGSLVYTNGGIVGASIGSAGATNSFSLTLDAGQTITVLAAPAFELQPIIELRDPSNTLIGTVTAAGISKRALLQTVPTTTTGVYTITIKGANSTTGSYTVQVTLNAALEAENYDGPSDNTLATAQNIDGSFLSLGGAATRGAVLGTADAVVSGLPNEIDPNNSIATANVASYNFASYSGNLYHMGITGTISAGNTEYFTLGPLQTGDFITVSDSGAASSRGSLIDPFVELYRANGGSPIRVTFDDDSGPGLDALIYRFAVTTPDTYYVRAMGFGASIGSYSLGIEVEDNAAPLATGGTFTTATGTNTSFATANDASTSWRPVQYLSPTNGTMSTRGDTDFYQYTFTAGDLVSVNINSTSTLNARVNLLNASGAILASEDGTSVGPATGSPLYAVLIPSTGTYYVQILGASGTGTYTANVYLSTSTAPPRASNGNDYYAFTLAAGDTVSLAVKGLTSGTVNLALQDGTGTTLATGVAGPTNVNQIITDFTAPSAGTYYALVTGTAGTNYSLVVTRDAELDTEPNNSTATAQPVHSLAVAGSQVTLGALTSGDVDYYQITLAANVALQAATATPGSAPGQPGNTLDPLLNLFNASGILVASNDNGGSDGRNALLNYTVPAGQGGTYFVEVAPSPLTGSPTTGDYILSVTGANFPGSGGVSASGTGLFVTAFTAMPSGFTASFSEPFVNSGSSPIHLYDAASAGYGPADVTLVGQATGVVHGSLLIDPSNRSFTFVKTGGVLAADTYTVTFVSGATAFRDATGAPLNGDGANPVNYVATFTVADSSAVVVSVPDFARGPDSADLINEPSNSTNGIPITLSNGSGVTDAVLVLQYNADLLTISGGSVNANLTGASFTVTTSGSGSSAQATIVFHSPTPLDSGAVQLGELTATVPSGAAYKSEELLHFSSVTLNDGAIAAVGDDGVQIVAFLGDTTGDGTYTSADSVLISQVASGGDSGLAAFPVVDPVILGDLNGDGRIRAADATLLNFYLNGTAEAQIPNYPGAPSNNPTEPDPTLSIPTALHVGSNDTLSVPVNIDDPRPDGSTGMTQALLALTYDPEVVSVSSSDIYLGTVPVSGTGWTLQSRVDATTGQIGIILFSATPIASTDSGSLVTINFHVQPGATVGVIPIHLAATINLTGQGVLRTAVDDNQGPFTLDLGPSNAASAADIPTASNLSAADAKLPPAAIIATSAPLVEPAAIVAFQADGGAADLVPSANLPIDIAALPLAGIPSINGVLAVGSTDAQHLADQLCQEELLSGPLAVLRSTEDGLDALLREGSDAAPGWLPLWDQAPSRSSALSCHPDGLGQASGDEAAVTFRAALDQYFETASKEFPA